MRRNHRRLLGLVMLVVVVATIASHWLAANMVSPLLAQSPPPSPSPLPSLAPTASTPLRLSPSPLPSRSPTLSIPLTPPPPPAPPASTAVPLPLGGDYQDPAGRFKIGILKDYKVSPLAGSVLVEAPDGRLAYSVVAQAQPATAPIGLSFDGNQEGLARVATAVFQRGEGFQPGTPQIESGGGIVMNWTGTLTIGGTPQPVGGVVIVRPTPKQILLLLIAATQTGANQVPGAVSALASTLQES